MQWNANTPSKRGDRRMQSAFLMFPKTINGKTRWLERAEWEEELGPHPSIVPFLGPREFGKWEGIRWADEPAVPLMPPKPNRPPPPPPPPPLRPNQQQIRVTHVIRYDEPEAGT